MATATLTRSRSKRPWTYEEMLAELPETTQPAELWDGELVMSPSPAPSHQTIVPRIWQALNSYVTARGLGRVFISPLDVVLTQRRVVQPDVFFVSKASEHIVQDRIRGVPDLIVEVISQGSWHRDRVDKKALYEQFQVPEYWIVDPDPQSVEVFALVKGTYQLHSRAEGAKAARSKLLAGFAVSFSQLDV